MKLREAMIVQTIVVIAFVALLRYIRLLPGDNIHLFVILGVGVVLWGIFFTLPWIRKGRGGD